MKHLVLHINRLELAETAGQKLIIVDVIEVSAGPSCL